MSFFRKKCINEVVENTKKGKLKRTLTAFDLFLLGLGAIIGTGIFVITGIAAAKLSGPAVTISYSIAGIVCIFVALTYTEVASMIPSSGSVYSYSYVALGEVFAWLVAWITSLYFLVSATTVASGWSGYIVNIFHDLGVHLPMELTKIPSEGGIINLPAVLITIFVTLMLIKGTKESAKLNSLLVFVKIAAIFLFIFIAIPHFNIANWFDHGVEFDKNLSASNSFMPYGIGGVMAGAALAFFGYNGFDSLAAATEEAKNPERDVTIGILSSLGACILLYVIVSGLLVGIINFDKLDVASPLALALTSIGNSKGSIIVASGAVAGMTSVIMLQMYSLTRMLFGMSRDGLVPKAFSTIHGKFQTPYMGTIIVGSAVALISGFAPLEVMGSLSSMGALFSYAMVGIVMLILRKNHPEFKRPFKCPAPYLVSFITVSMCFYLIFTLLPKAGLYFFAWIIVGLLIYFFYSYRNSHYDHKE